MEIQYDFDDLMDTSGDFDEFHSLERLSLSPEDSGEDSESLDSDAYKRVLPTLVKTDSPVKRLEEDENLSPELIAAESESSSDGDWWEEAQRAAEEMRRKSEQERMLREREKLMRRMRANFQVATHSFSAFEEEEDDEDCHGFSLRKTKRAWLRDMPKSVAVLSNFRIVRTCVTEPDVVEVIVDFRRSNEL